MIDHYLVFVYFGTHFLLLVSSESLAIWKAPFMSSINAASRIAFLCASIPGFVFLIPLSFASRDGFLVLVVVLLIVEQFIFFLRKWHVKQMRINRKNKWNTNENNR